MKRFVPSDTKNEHKYLVIKTVGKGKRIDKQTNTTGHSVPNCAWMKTQFWLYSHYKWEKIDYSKILKVVNNVKNILMHTLYKNKL